MDHFTAFSVVALGRKVTFDKSYVSGNTEILTQELETISINLKSCYCHRQEKLLSKLDEIQALAVPASQSLKKYKPLDASRLNTLRCKLEGLKLILLDGISMVGTAMFNVQINNRLKDIKGNGKDFGGISIIVIGDLFQLKPVMNGYVFKDTDNSEYGVLAPNLWHQYFKTLELQEIMRSRELKFC